jgi:hypothetical protein
MEVRQGFYWVLNHQGTKSTMVLVGLNHNGKMIHHDY